MLNTTWVVPSNPTDMQAGDRCVPAPRGARAVTFRRPRRVSRRARTRMCSGAPGWWFGIQNTKGNGALIQPILAWGYMGPV